MCDVDTVVDTALPRITAPRTFLKLTVAATGVLTADAPIDVTTDLTVSGPITHSAYPTKSGSVLQLTVQDRLEVLDYGVIHGYVKGLSGDGAGY